MRVRRLMLLALFVASCSTKPVVEGTHPIESGPFRVPSAQHVFVVVLENEDETRAVLEPFMAQLAGRGALLRSFHAITHPSQPNYIALTSGSTYGVRTNLQVNLDVRHIGDLVEARNLRWKTYAESYPGDCYLGMYAGSRSTGEYVRRHVPFLSYRNVQRDPRRCANVVDARELERDV